MTEEQIKLWAKEAGFNRLKYIHPKTGIHYTEAQAPDSLQRFAQLVRNNALEEAADACETLYYGMRFQPTKGECADKIRSLKS